MRCLLLFVCVFGSNLFFSECPSFVGRFGPLGVRRQSGGILQGFVYDFCLVASFVVECQPRVALGNSALVTTERIRVCLCVATMGLFCTFKR